MVHENISISSLNSFHDKSSFSCGVDSLDQYLAKRATQYLERGLAVTYVLTANSSNIILGYYTLSSTSINLTSLPESIVKKLPRYPHVPATLIGRLAVSKIHQKKKYGEILLIDALRKSLEYSNAIGSIAVIVDAENEKIIDFYKKYGFFELNDCKSKLFLPMKTIAKLFA